jgi:hypothetical protein
VSLNEVFFAINDIRKGDVLDYAVAGKSPPWWT